MLTFISFSIFIINMCDFPHYDLIFRIVFDVPTLFKYSVLNLSDYCNECSFCHSLSFLNCTEERLYKNSGFVI